MFTVKQVLSTGHEDLITARRISYQPVQRISEGEAPIPETLHIEGEDGQISPWYQGTFYVMNSAGSTVAKYQIGALSTS